MKPFDPNDRAAIMAALELNAQDDPICEALVLRMNDLVDQLLFAVQGTGRPIRLRVQEPQTALDEIALGLFRDFLAAHPSSPDVSIGWRNEVIH